MAPESLPHLIHAGLAGLTAAALTLFLTPLVRAIAVRMGWVSRPVDDRWGRRVVARLGGAAMFVSLTASLFLWVPVASGERGLLFGLTLVVGLGLVDDLRRMPPYLKLVGQLLIGCVVVLSGIRFSLDSWGWVAIPLSVLWFVLIMNAFNLLDNMDGLAAGVGAIAAGFCAFHAAQMGQWTAATIAAIVSGACLGFLRSNFPPAKIFMGDAGSHLLGLSLAALPLMAHWRHSTHLVSVLAVPAFVLAVPIFDTFFVTVQRLRHRQHPFTGGTDHVSHRLAILGLSVRQTVLALYVVSAGFGLLSVVSARQPILLVLALWLLVVTGLLLCGRFLAKVNVYRMERPAAAQPALAPDARVTLIDTMLLHKRRLVEVLVDFALVTSSYVLAHLLRFEGTLTSEFQHRIIQSLPLILLIKFACFAGCGLYRGMWRYLGMSDLLTMAKSVTLGSAVSALALLYLWRFEGYSRAVLVIDWMLSFLAIGGSRVVERLLVEWIGAVAESRIPVLIVGAGDTGELIVRSLRYEGAAGGRRAVAFLDDDARKHGNRIHGLPVLGGRGRLAPILQRYRIREVLVAIPDPPGDLLTHVQQCCEPHGIRWKVVTVGVATP